MVYGGLLKDGPALSAVFRMCRFQWNEVYRAVPRLVTESSHMRAVRRRNDTAMGESHAGSRSCSRYHGPWTSILINITQ